MKALLLPERTRTATSTSEMATTQKSKMLKDSDMKSVNPSARSCKTRDTQNACIPSETPPLKVPWEYTKHEMWILSLLQGQPRTLAPTSIANNAVRYVLSLSRCSCSLGLIPSYSMACRGALMSMLSGHYSKTQDIDDLKMPLCQHRALDLIRRAARPVI